MTGKNRPTSYYFDSCVYLAYLRNEIGPYTKRKISAIGTIWNQSERGQCAIMTSAITITEVLSHKLTKDAEKKFNHAIESIHQVEDVTPPIAERARKYRDHYQRMPVSIPGSQTTRSGLSTPDALHLATAVIFECDQFWTFDGLNATGKKKDIGLLWLGNRAGEDSLIICQPETGELELL